MAVEFEDVVEFRGLLDYANELAQQQIVNLWWALVEASGASGAVFRDMLLEGVRRILLENRGMAVDASAVFYQQTQGVPMVDKHLRAAKVVNEEQLAKNVNWALNAEGEAALARLSGVAQRHIYGGARDYAVGAIQDTYSGGWYRMAMPGACEFCKMLATRALYEWGPYGSADAAVTVGKGKSRARGTRQEGELFHDNCRCIPIKADEFEPHAEMEEWGDEYRVAREIADDLGLDPNNVRSLMKVWREIDSGQWEWDVDDGGNITDIRSTVE